MISTSCPALNGRFSSFTLPSEETCPCVRYACCNATSLHVVPETHLVLITGPDSNLTPRSSPTNPISRPLPSSARWYSRADDLSPLARPSLRFLVEDGADGFEEGVAGGVLAAVGQVEAVVEVRRVGALRVLQDGFQLVERLGEPRLGGGGGLVLVPQLGDLVAQPGRERLQEAQQVAALVGRLAGAARRLLG